MKNKIHKIKKAIMDAFPNANGVVVLLDDDIMKITVVPCAAQVRTNTRQSSWRAEKHGSLSDL